MGSVIKIQISNWINKPCSASMFYHDLFKVLNEISFKALNLWIKLYYKLRFATFDLYKYISSKSAS